MPAGTFDQPRVGIQTELAATTSGKGASLVGIQDAAANFTGTDVEAALAENAASAAANTAAVFAKRTVTVLHSDLTEASNGVLESVNIGAVLPANAVVVAHEVDITTLFSGGTVASVACDVGGTDVDAIVNALDVFTGAATGKLTGALGVHSRGIFTAEQLVVSFTPDGSAALLALDAGELDVTVWYHVLA